MKNKIPVGLVKTTFRIPAAVYAALDAMAYRKRTSMNRELISALRLWATLDEQGIPAKNLLDSLKTADISPAKCVNSMDNSSEMSAEERQLVHGVLKILRSQSGMRPLLLSLVETAVRLEESYDSVEDAERREIRRTLERAEDAGSEDMGDGARVQSETRATRKSRSSRSRNQ